MEKRLYASIIFLMIAGSVGASISADYEVIVADNGDSFVFISLDGNGTINLPLPLDVDSPQVEGAIYLQAENGINVLVVPDESPLIIYTTPLLTSKSGEKWIFEMDIPLTDHLNVALSLPKNIAISQVIPKDGAIRELNDSKDVSWTVEDKEGQSIRVEYAFLEKTPSQEKEEEEGETSVPEFPPQYLVIAVIAIIILLTYLYLNHKKSETLVLSKGKRNVMKTLSGNEIKIINILLEHEGKMMRNELERLSGIAKSSLAAAINNLEKKNVLQVDKSEWTHTVKLTEWFKSL